MNLIKETSLGLSCLLAFCFQRQMLLEPRCLQHPLSLGCHTSLEKIFAAFPRILDCSLTKMAPGLIALWAGRKSPGEQTCTFLTCCSFCSLALFSDFCLAEAGGWGLQGAGAELHLHRGSLCLYRALDLSARVNRPFKRTWGDTHGIPCHSGTCLSFTHISSSTRHGPQEGRGSLIIKQSQWNKLIEEDNV